MVERGLGSSLPPAFEKIKCIFSIAPVGNFGEVTGRWCW